MELPSRAWISNVATQALAQTLGTLLAALIIVLGAAAFGFFNSLSAGDLLAIATATIALVSALLGGSLAWRQRAVEAEEREREEVLRRSFEEMMEMTKRREAEIDDMREKGEL